MFRRKICTTSRRPSLRWLCNMLESSVSKVVVVSVKYKRHKTLLIRVPSDMK